MDKSAEKTEIENAIPRRRNLRPAIFLTAVILVAVGVFTVIMLNKKKEEPKSSNNNTATTSSSDSVENAENTVTVPGKRTEETKTEEKPEKENPDNNLESDDGKTPIQQDSYTGEPGVLTGVINYADSDGETLMIRVAIDQYLESGECLLELNSSNDSFSITDQIAPSASTSSCSYDISTGLLNEGKYNIKITLKSGDKTGIIEGEVNV